ncbi:MAG: hypothetical protein F6K09_18125 [Merismopedia sp. SIO2A8]|nr:hypothetical protein [Symploca sp. SIO2B6]NET50570.1 hypothetical protein [Merismopedia sp. SIO2A8]
MTEWIGCTVSNEELAQIDALIVRTGQTRDEWLQSLVRNALSETPHNIRHLTERVVRLEQHQDLVKALTLQVNTLAQQLQPQPSTMSVEAGKTDDLEPQILEDDDLNDQPDEILYEFLEPASSSASSSSESSYSSDSNIYDADDEPDEVLYDFLDEDERPF